MNRYGVTQAKVRCEFCDFPVHRGNLPRHQRACIRRADAKRRRALLEQAKTAGDPWAPYRVGGPS